MTSTEGLPSSLKLLSTLNPSSESRAWLTSPHPRLPIVATCTADRTVRVYSLRDFTLQSTISGGHKRSIRTCAWKPGVKGESVLATGSFDAAVGIWRRWDSYNQADGGSGSTGGLQGNGTTENTEEDEEWNFAVILDGPESEVKSVSWSAGGNLLAVSSRDKSVWIWEDVGNEADPDDKDNYETVAVLQEHDGDVKCVTWHPSEELLVSASYDGTIKMWREEVDDWACISTIDGHDATVWEVSWEGGANEYNEGATGPRLVSCSDDLTVRVWERKTKETTSNDAKVDRIPSIIRPAPVNEVWIEQCVIPQRHERSIYSVAWSPFSGRIVSSGGDGRIVVYQEVPADAGMFKWVIVAEVQAAHDVFEINHVTWAKRADAGKRDGGEEVVISTGDNGEVRVWAFN
jgi:cytosolic iron-sulfur protein assembly protein CIAO1